MLITSNEKISLSGHADLSSLYPNNHIHDSDYSALDDEEAKILRRQQEKAEIIRQAKRIKQSLEIASEFRR